MVITHLNKMEYPSNDDMKLYLLLHGWRVLHSAWDEKMHDAYFPLGKEIGFWDVDIKKAYDTVRFKDIDE